MVAGGSFKHRELPFGFSPELPLRVIYPSCLGVSSWFAARSPADFSRGLATALWYPACQASSGCAAGICNQVSCCSPELPAHPCCHTALLRVPSVLRSQAAGTSWLPVLDKGCGWRTVLAPPSPSQSQPRAALHFLQSPTSRFHSCHLSQCTVPFCSQHHNPKQAR